MTALPRNLFCLNLAYNIDDRDVVEQLLIEFPEETEQCISIALRNMLTVDYLPIVPFFSNQVLSSYLSMLWSDQSPNDKLLDAADNGLIYLAAYYLDRGVDIHAHNDIALRYAAYNGHTETVKLLLDRKADIHAVDDWALGAAAEHGHTDTVILLLDRKADIHADHDHALKWAARNGHTETVKLLLDRNADVHAEHDWALRYAVKNGHIDTVKLLRSYMT
jgi:ankyrin repeat protein